jgi:hypothetical protein
VDLVREDLACISLKAKNKDLLAEKSFGLKGKDDGTKEEAEAEAGTSAEQEKSLADKTNNAERLDLVEGNATGEDDQGQVSTFRQVMDQRDDKKNAIDKANEKDVKEQVWIDDWDMEMNEENEQKVSQTEEDNLEEEKTRVKSKNKSEVQGDGLDDAEEAIKINEVDMMRQDFACISLKTKNKELDPLAQKLLEIKSKDDETKEEAEAKVNAGIKTENQEGALEDTV